MCWNQASKHPALSCAPLRAPSCSPGLLASSHVRAEAPLLLLQLLLLLPLPLLLCQPRSVRTACQVRRPKKSEARPGPHQPLPPPLLLLLSQPGSARDRVPMGDEISVGLFWSSASPVG